MDGEGEPKRAADAGRAASLPPLHVPSLPSPAFTQATVAMLRAIATHWHFPSIATPEDIRAVADSIGTLLKEQDQ